MKKILYTVVLLTAVVLAYIFGLMPLSSPRDMRAVTTILIQSAMN